MSHVDASTLKWVKTEIDETLSSAQTALENYVEDTADESQLRFCINYLHQVHGSLQMVELYGAALAVDEMERLSQAIFDNNIDNKQDAYETLMRGILQIPDYLEHLLAGNPEMPIVLLPLLNDMRAARNEPLLSEGALFTPDLNVSAPTIEASSKNSEDLAELASSLRHDFHLGLLAWFKDKNSKAGLKKISDVISKLIQAAESEQARRVFWIASGLIESIEDDGVDSSVAVKMLMGHVDRQIKKIIDQGSHALDEAPPEELEKNLLYYVASSTTEGEFTRELKDAFKLKELMPDRQALEQARADLDAPNAALMGTVSSVIIDDINKVKENLDVFVRSDEKDMSIVDDVHKSLMQMSDTLAMLNLGEQQDAVLEQAKIIKDMAAGLISADETELMDVATALITVEKSMNELSEIKTVDSEKSGGLSEHAPMEAEQKVLLQAVLDEAKINLSKVKNALTEFNSNKEVSEQVNSIPELLEQIQGSFDILSLEHASKLLSLTNYFIRNNIIKNAKALSSNSLNNLADAISSLEYYMESLSGEWGHPDDILNIAEQSLAMLGINAKDEIPADSEASSDENSDKGEPEELSLDSFLSGESEDDTISETVVEVDFSQTLEKNIANNKINDTIDDEIIEIFLEEADEAYAAISELLPAWVANNANQDALKEIRRAYHTLKGSGRLVGAIELGEFAWAFENMLNRVLDSTILVTPELLTLMEQGKQALPSLFQAFKSNTQSDESILALIGKVDGLSKTVQIDDEIDSETLPVNIDSTLLDIYRKETATHCDTLKKYIVDWNLGNKKVSSNLLRALHTLTGSSRTTGVQSLASVCICFENYSKHLEDMNVALPDVALSELENIIILVETTVACLDKAGASLPEHEALLKSIEQLPKESSGLSSVTKDVEVMAGSTSDYDEELLEIFLEEANEILTDSDHTIHDWLENPDDIAFVKELQRQLHTLKGGARMAGITEIGDLGHSMESLLTKVVDDNLSLEKPMFDLVLRAQDRLVTMVESIQQQSKLEAANDLIDAVDEMLGNKPVAHGDEPEGELTLDALDDSEEIIITEPNISHEVEISELESIEEELNFDIGLLIDEPELNLDDEIRTKKILDENELTLDDVIDEKEIAVDNEPELEKTTEETVKEIFLDNEETSPESELVADGDAEKRSLNRGQAEQVRVRADLLDNLVNFAGEVSIYRSRLEQQTNNFRYNINEFDDTVNRLREQLRQFEIETETQIEYKNEDLSSAQEKFDPLEMDRFTTMQHLSRAMMESLGDLDSLGGILHNLTRESETLLLQQSRVNTDLQEGLMRTRMVPFSGHLGRLRRIVRQTCDELGKQAELNLSGMESELDRSVLERIISPIEHMLRNAIAHGIENPETRQQIGKSETGVIDFSIANEGSDIVIKITDDGAGINLEAIRNKAIEKGLLHSNEDASKEVLLDMIMQSGFSTADSVSQISGRGVGMDVVNTEIKQLGGVFHIDTNEGKGTTFTVSLPLTLAISRALMVVVGDDTYAVPLLSVKGIERVSVKEIKDIMSSESKAYSWDDEEYKFMQLASVMGSAEINLDDDSQQLPLLIVRSGEYRAAMLVDGLLGSREIVVKSVGPQLSTLRGISGATVMGDGSVVLIIDLATVIRLVLTTDANIETTTPLSAATENIDVTLPQVMVVDDSITVRKVTSRLLERNEMQVILAKDGVDALAQLQEATPDIMLLDVEMPRMDGFELATNMRNDERLKDIPIIMITSRTGKKHRDRAESIGVNVYMGKPYTEVDLLENIETLLGENV